MREVVAPLAPEAVDTDHEGPRCGMGAEEHVEELKLLVGVGVHHGEIDEAGGDCRVEVGGVEQARGGVADDGRIEARGAGELGVGPALAVIGLRARQRRTERQRAPGIGKGEQDEQSQAAAKEDAEQMENEGAPDHGQNWK